MKTRLEFIKIVGAGLAWANFFTTERAVADNSCPGKRYIDDWDYLRRKWRESCINPATGLERDAFRESLGKLVEKIKWVDPWPMVKAKSFALACDQVAIGISSHDWFPAFPVWRYDYDLPFAEIRARREAEVNEKYAPGLSQAIQEASLSGQFTVWKDYDHCAPDWDRILSLGFKGMKAELLRSWQETDYYRSKLVAIDAVFRFLDRLIAETKRVATVESGEMWGRVSKEAASLERLRDGKPKTAYDVLMFIYLFWVMGEQFDAYQVRTLGNLDRLLTPYYREDLASNRTTEAEFRNQLIHFWWQWGSLDNYYGQPLYVGGTRADGASEYNEVSKIILDVHDELNLPTPKMHLKMSKTTPEWVWRKSIDMARRQRSVSFCGEEPIARAMKACGYTAEEARTCALWGCYEWSVRDGANTAGSGHQNLLKNIELILSDAKAGRFSATTFAGFKKEFFVRLRAALERQAELILKNNELLALVNPSNMFSLSLAYSVERGLEPMEGGTARGNNAVVMMIGLGSAVDALMAIKEIVYERRLVDLKGLGAIMAENWKGHDRLRLQILRSKRKWGNNDKEANELGAEIVHFCSGILNGRPNACGGGRILLSSHTARLHIELGRRTGATPDGRKAGDEMSKNVSPTMGVDTEGVTALLNTVANLDARDLPGDLAVDIAVLPTTVAGEKGMMVMRTVIEQFFANNGMVIQFNVQNAEVLRDAQLHPEKYENLQVRVCGWNVRWNDIPRTEQDFYIRRAEHICE